MKKLEDFLVTGLYEDVEPSPVVLTAYTKKYKKQGYDDAKAEAAAREELKVYRELGPGRAAAGKTPFSGGRQLISSGPQFDVSTEQGRAEKTAYETGKDLMGAIQRGASEGEKEFFAQQARDANTEANRLQRSAQRISPMYWVTQGDFEKATGRKYDARSADDRRLLFDLNSSGESTVAPTAGVGQGPSYDSLEYHTMRRRPKEVPQFGTPEARYDVVDGQIANTTPESRRRARSQEDDRLARERIDAEMAAQDAAIRAQAEKNVAGELALDYVKNWGQPDIDKFERQKERQNYIDSLTNDLDYSGYREVQEPDEQRTYIKRYEPSAISGAQNALAGAAGRFVSDKAKDVSDFLKKNLMTYNPYPREERGADPDIQRGQFPIYPDENTGGMNATGSIEDFERTQPQPPIPWALGVEKQLKKYRAKSTKDQMPPDAPEEPIQYGIGPEKYQQATYVVPESEAWNNMSPEEQVAMTVAALQRNEAHKLFGGREAKKGGFLGFGGERTARFIEDNLGQTPEETARLNRQAKMLNKLLDEYDLARPEEPESGANPVVSAAVETGAGMGVQTGEPKGFKRSELPFNAADAISRLSGKKRFSTKEEMPGNPKVPFNSADIITKLSGNKRFSTQADIPSDFEAAYEKWRETNAAEKRYNEPVKLVVPGQGFEAETGSEGGMDAEAYQRSTERFSTRNELAKAIRNEFIKITGRMPIEGNQADAYLLRKINAKEISKRNLDPDLYRDVR
jgi:hypothetical protein